MRPALPVSPIEIVWAVLNRCLQGPIYIELHLTDSALVRCCSCNRYGVANRRLVGRRHNGYFRISASVVHVRSSVNIRMRRLILGKGLALVSPGVVVVVDKVGGRGTGQVIGIVVRRRIVGEEVGLVRRIVLEESHISARTRVPDHGVVM